MYTAPEKLSSHGLAGFSNMQPMKRAEKNHWNDWISIKYALQGSSEKKILKNPGTQAEGEKVEEEKIIYNGIQYRYEYTYGSSVGQQR